MAYFNTSLDQLPALDAAGQQHAAQVLSHLAELIEAGEGFIGFDDYMQVVLYAPGLGYYSAGSEKFGAGGDYVTAPLISPLFSQALAHYTGRLLGADDAVLELGAGTGVMAADMLVEFSSMGLDIPCYQILESSADLRQRQAESLKNRVPDRQDRVRWLDHLPEDQSFRGAIIGNEVIDAMPVKRFALQSGQVLELGVGLCEDQLCWKTRTPDAAFEQAVLSLLPQPIDHYPDGYVSEVLDVCDAWFSALYQCMDSGIVVLLDYGHEQATYYEPDRMSGSLRAYYRHHVLTDPFIYPGMADLTASVDFTRVAEAAVAAGFQLDGYTSQANFLMDAGLAELAVRAQQAGNDDRSRLAVAEAIKTLTDPGEMGESVKVVVLSKGRDIEAMFSRDQRYRL